MATAPDAGHASAIAYTVSPLRVKRMSRSVNAARFASANGPSTTAVGPSPKVVHGRGGTSLVSFNEHAHLEQGTRSLVTYR